MISILADSTQLSRKEEKEISCLPKIAPIYAMDIFQQSIVKITNDIGHNDRGKRRYDSSFDLYQKRESNGGNFGKCRLT